MLLVEMKDFGMNLRSLIRKGLGMKIAGRICIILIILSLCLGVQLKGLTGLTLGYFGCLNVKAYVYEDI